MSLYILRYMIILYFSIYEYLHGIIDSEKQVYNASYNEEFAIMMIIWSHYS